MKKIMALLMVFAFALGVAGCSSSAAYKDGTYEAESKEASDSGWKDKVTITVKGGKITEVNWNGSSEAVAEDKKTYSENGGYAMVAKGNSQAEWHEEAAIMEAKLVELQDPTKIKLDAEGKADGISGVTIHVNGFVSLAEEALKSAK